MGIKLVSASSQYIINSQPSSYFPVSGHPCTMGCWFKPASATAGDTLSLGQTLATNFCLSIGMSATPRPILTGRDGANNTITILTTMTLGLWHFAVGRFINTSNRRLSVLYPDGTVRSVNDTATISTPTNLGALSVGCRLTSAASTFFDGNIAEAWWMDADICDSAANVPTWLMFQLAYGGPFSNPDLAPHTRDYLGMRRYIPPIHDCSPNDDMLCQAPELGIENWFAPTANGILSDHPPLPYWYVRPEEQKAMFVV